MLRYIYLLCIINFELVYCYSSIRKGKFKRSEIARARRREYESDDSPLMNIDVVGFMQKPDEAEDFDPYMYENKQTRSKYEDLSLDDSAPRLRRRSRPGRSNNMFNARSTSPDQHQPRRHLARHPKRKCTFSLFPFFSHKNKTKLGPSSKHKRKSHSLFKSKHRHAAVTPEQKVTSHQNIQITTEPISKCICPKMKIPRAKKSLPNMIHNGRQFASNFKMDNETLFGLLKFKNTRDESKGRPVSKYDARYDDEAMRGENERELTGGESKDTLRADKNYLLVQQRDQLRRLEEIEKRLSESSHVLRSLLNNNK